jgi:hypothetical protein
VVLPHFSQLVPFSRIPLSLWCRKLEETINLPRIPGPEVGVRIIGPPALLQAICKFSPIQQEAAQGTTTPKLDHQPVEQCLAREVFGATIEADIENLG